VTIYYRWCHTASKICIFRQYSCIQYSCKCIFRQYSLVSVPITQRNWTFITKLVAILNFEQPFCFWSKQYLGNRFLVSENIYLDVFHRFVRQLQAEIKSLQDLRRPCWIYSRHFVKTEKIRCLTIQVHSEYIRRCLCQHSCLLTKVHNWNLY